MRYFYCESCDETGRVSIENFVKKGVYCEKNSVLTIVRANRREDSGQYRIRLTCSGGSGEATGKHQTWLQSLTSGGVNFRQCQCYRCPIKTEKFHCRRGRSGTFHIHIGLLKAKGVWVKGHHCRLLKHDYPQLSRYDRDSNI